MLFVESYGDDMIVCFVILQSKINVFEQTVLKNNLKNSFCSCSFGVLSNVTHASVIQFTALNINLILTK